MVEDPKALFEVDLSGLNIGGVIWPPGSVVMMSEGMAAQVERIRQQQGQGTPVDFRDLLKRYIRRVGDSEGVTFIPANPCGPNTALNASWPVFTREDIDALEALEREGVEDEKREIAEHRKAKGWDVDESAAQVAPLVPITPRDSIPDPVTGFFPPDNELGQSFADDGGE